MDGRPSPELRALVRELVDSIERSGVATGRRPEEFGPVIQRGRETILERDAGPQTILEYNECPGLATFYVSALYEDDDLTELTLTGLVTVTAKFGVGAEPDEFEFDVRHGEVFTVPANDVIMVARFADETNNYDRAIIRAYGVPGTGADNPSKLTRTFPRVTVPAGGNIFIPIPKYAAEFTPFPRETGDIVATVTFFFNTGTAADVAQSLGSATATAAGLARNEPFQIPGGAQFVRINNADAVAHIYTPVFFLSL